MSARSSDTQVLIAGGGPAGAAAAILLARAGQRVLLVEREAAPREKVCGEFLGADALACLAALGLDPLALGAVPIGETRIARGAGAARLALPFAACGLPRAVLDEALLGLAAEAGATLLRGQVVRDAVRVSGGRDGDGWCLRLADGALLRAPRLVLATGKHALRGFPRAGAAEGWVGAKLHVQLRAPLDAVVLLPFPGGYAGLQPSANGVANLCAALTPTQAAGARDAAGFLALVATGSTLARSLLEDARPTMPRPLTVAGVPYGFLHRDARDADAALWRVGDQFAVIPSFLGDGNAMALASGMAAADSILAGGTALEFHAAWRKRLARPMRIAAIAGFALRHNPGLFAGVIAAVPSLARHVARRTRVVRIA